MYQSDIKIRRIVGFLPYLSTGMQTVGVIVEASNGLTAWEAAPVGTTTGKNDPATLRIKDLEKTCEALNNALTGKSLFDQRSVDGKLREVLSDRNGAIQGVDIGSASSVAVAKLAAMTSSQPLFRYLAEMFGVKCKEPQLISNMLGGGGHHQNAMQITELMVIGNCPVAEGLATLRLIHDQLRQTLTTNGQAIQMGLEGCFVPQNLADKEAIDILSGVLDQLHCDQRWTLGFDLAGRVNVGDASEMVRNSPRTITYIEDMQDIDEHPLFNNLEKPCSIFASDDYTAGNIAVATRLFENRQINSLVIKMNHWDSLSSIWDAISVAKSFGGQVIFSQRSQETCLTTMAHLSVGLAGDYLKFGSPIRERLATYNEVLAIGQQLL